jgi:predicted transcriptional regulator
MAQQDIIDILRTHKTASSKTIFKEAPGIGIKSIQKNLQRLIKQGVVKRETYSYGERYKYKIR